MDQSFPRGKQTFIFDCYYNDHYNNGENYENGLL